MEERHRESILLEASLAPGESKHHDFQPQQELRQQLVVQPQLYKSTTRESTITFATRQSRQRPLDLERQRTNTSFAELVPTGSLHGFDISRVDTVTSIQHHAALSTINSGSSAHALPFEEPPDGGYAWVIVLAVFLINAHTWGINSSYGVFLAHYLAEPQLYPGSTPLQYAFIGALSISCGVLVSPVASFLSRSIGLKATLLLGTTVEAGSLIGASFATSLWQLFLSQGVGFGVGFGLLFVGSAGSVSQWFTTKRSLANGLATAGSGIGGLIYSLATQYMLQSLGQPWTFRVLGILAFSVNGIAALMLRERPSTVTPQSSSLSEANTTTTKEQETKFLRQLPIRPPTFPPSTLLQKPTYLLLLAYSTLSLLGYVSLLFSLSSYARNIVHLPASRAALLTALLNLSQGFGRPTIGLFSDRIGRINMASLGTFLAGLSAMAIWTSADNFGLLVFFSIVGGFFIGTFWATIAPVTAEVVGELDLIAPGLNLIWLVLAVPCTFAAPIAFSLTELERGGYLGCQLFAGAMLVGAAGVLALVRGWLVVGEEEKGEEDEEEEEDKKGSMGGNGNEKKWIRRVMSWKKV